MPKLPSRQEIIAEVRAVYADLAARPIDRDCIRRTECCQFQLTGKIPYLTRGEAILAAQALKASGRTKLPERADGACPLLTPAGKCLIYQDRPLGCRTHFCAAAGGPYGRNEVRDLIQRLEDLDECLGADGSRALPVALATVLRQGDGPSNT